MQFHNTIAKLLENPISIPILKLLAKNQLSIPQITKSLQDIDTDTQTVIAVLGELYHFGLVERVEPTVLDTSTQNRIQPKTDAGFSPEPRPKIYTTPLGIPLPAYVSLWEEVNQHPDQLNSSELNSWLFSVPEYLRKKLEDLTLEEIRNKILSDSF